MITVYLTEPMSDRCQLLVRTIVMNMDCHMEASVDLQEFDSCKTEHEKKHLLKYRILGAILDKIDELKKLTIDDIKLEYDELDPPKDIVDDLYLILKQENEK